MRINDQVKIARKECWSNTPVHKEGICCWCDYLRDYDAQHGTPVTNGIPRDGKP